MNIQIRAMKFQILLFITGDVKYTSRMKGYTNCFKAFSVPSRNFNDRLFSFH